MARKTLIRTDRAHEVKLGAGDRLAQSHRLDAQELEAIPPALRKAASSARAPKAKTPSVAKVPGPSTVSRKKATGLPLPNAAPAARSARTSRSAATQAKPPVPHLPAHVPADRLWEDDSTVMKRLHALQEHNARLAEQLQRIPLPALPKGFEP